MATADCCVTAEWLVPIEPRGVVLNQAGVIIQGSKIVAVGTREVLEAWQVRERIDLPGHVLMPGLVNAHAHSPMTLLRGLADDLALHDWLETTIWPAEQTLLDQDFVTHGTWVAIDEMIKSGTTCFNEHYFYPEASLDVVVASGMRACVGLPVMRFPMPYANDQATYLAKAQAILDCQLACGRTTLAMAPHSPYALNDDGLRQVAKMAKTHGIPIHMHVHETTKEVADSVAEWGERPLARLKRLGLLDTQLTAVHVTDVTAEEIAMLASHRASVVTCPDSNLKLASGFCPVQALLDAGVNVALGTDGAASNNDLDLMAEMRTAALLAKAVAGDPCAVDAHAALRLATLGGAKALGLEASIGSLTVGKQADMIAVNLDVLHCYPLHQPISQLVYASRSNQVQEAWVAGVQLLSKGQSVRWSEADVRGHAQRWAERTAGFSQS